MPLQSNELSSAAASYGAPDPARRPSISVVVPTRDRPLALTRCLNALAAQSIADELEVIVVDDGSVAEDGIAAIVRRYARARLIRRARGGPSAARNAGALAAEGGFLCFLDDDCEPARDWVERLVEALRRGADAAAGTTLSGGGLLAAASEIVARAPAAAPAPPGSDLAFAPSNNLACTRTAFLATSFDESYPDAAGEDREWCARLLAAGHVFRSEPSARLVHHQELTVGGFLRQQVRYGRGAFRFRRRSGVRRPLESPAFYKGLVRQAFAEGLTVGLLVSIAQAAAAAGFAGAWLADMANGVRVTNRAASRSFRRDES